MKFMKEGNDMGVITQAKRLRDTYGEVKER